MFLMYESHCKLLVEYVTMKSSESKNSLVVSAISNWGPLISNTLVSLLITPYLINKLGDVKFQPGSVRYWKEVGLWQD